MRVTFKPQGLESWELSSSAACLLSVKENLMDADQLLETPLLQASEVPATKGKTWPGALSGTPEY